MENVNIAWDVVHTILLVFIIFNQLTITYTARVK